MSDRSTFNPADVAAGQKIAEIRKGLGWSQGELARRAGTSQQLISDTERGERSLRLPELTRVSAALGAAPTVILDAIPTEQSE